ncbi:ribonuclease H-like domain, reverse transcriptase, RNA-dependent DNA polymerase [Tanacetum coccineum]
MGVFTNASYDDEGAVADFSNLETTMNVSPIATSRIHSIHPTTQTLRDPTSTVQTRSKVNKSSRANAFVSYIKKQRRNNHKNKKDERGVVVRNKARLVAHGYRQEEKIDYDEVFTPVARIESIRIFLAFASFMGFNVYQMDVKSAFFSKSLDKYVAEILKKFDFANVKSASTPIETQKPLNKDEEAADVDVHLYRSMIGSLMYLTASRPDIMYAVCACSRFQVTPKTSHLHAVKRIFRYLKGKPKLGLWYPRVSSFDLEAYSDHDYARANLDRKSTTGGCQFLCRKLILWQCKKQTIMATSTTEAEYVAAANSCGASIVDSESNFWNTATSKTVNDVSYIKAKVAGKTVSLSEASIRRDLLFNDVDGIDCHVTPLFPNMLAQAIVDEGEGSEQPTKPQLTPSPTQPSTGDQPSIPHDSPLSGGHTSDRVEGGLNLDELLVLCTNLSNKVLALETSKDAQAAEILKLETRIKKLEKKCKPRISDHKAWLRSMSRLSRIKSLGKKESGRRSNETEELNLDADTEEIVKDKGSGEKGVSTRSITTLKPLPSIDPKDKGKGVLEEPEPAKKMTRSDFDAAQVARDAEVARQLEVKLQAEVEKERQREEQASMDYIANLYDEVQARIDDDHELAVRLTHKEQEKYTVMKRAKQLAEIFESEKKQHQRQAAAIRNKPLTRTQLRSLMMTYLKHTGRDAFGVMGYYSVMKKSVDVATLFP